LTAVIEWWENAAMLNPRFYSVSLVVAVTLFAGVMTGHAADAEPRYELVDLDSARRALERGDYTTAVAMMRVLADDGDAEAQTNLGTLYVNGRGVPQDYQEALRWFRKAANQGEALAQAKLGLLYYEGNGVPQDYVQAHMWYNLAAAQGNETPRELRDDLSKQLTSAQIAEAQKMAREWEPTKDNLSVIEKLKLWLCSDK
jgi:TPR repeat protein